MKKNIVYYFLLTLLSIVLISPVAKAETIINKMGVNIDKNDIESLKKIFSEEEINTLPQDMYDYLKGKEWYKKDVQEIYIENTTFYIDNLHTITSERIISEEEYNNVSINSTSEFNEQSQWETTYKKLMITLSANYEDNNHLFTTELIWKIMPAVRSYDIIASRGSSNYIFGDRPSHVNVFYTDNLTNYQNTLTTPAVTAQNGVSYVINLPTSTNLTALTVKLYAIGKKTNSSTARVYSSYQHATSSVTLAQAKNHTFAAGGLGNVISFSNSTIAGKYDGMQGVMFYMYSNIFDS